VTTGAIVAVAVTVVLALALIAFFRSQAREQVQAAQDQTRRLQAVLDDVKEVAWSNRDIAPDLSTIVIDTIRTGEQRLGRRELPS
jgi:cytochrome c-type biogenesis protein CcmH/NrfF